MRGCKSMNCVKQKGTVSVFQIRTPKATGECLKADKAQKSNSPLKAKIYKYLQLLSITKA